MNNGSLRGSRSTSRSDASARQNLAYRQAASRVATKEEAQPPAEEPASPALVKQTSAPKPSKRPVWPIVLVVVGLAIASVFAWLVMNSRQAVLVGIDTDKYQAVFLSNGQVYFGKLSTATSDYLQLTDVYYLERQITPTDPEAQEAPVTEDNNFQLLKYSDVLYGSEDLMVISRSDVLRYENLRPDGVVARAIADRD